MLPVILLYEHGREIVSEAGELASAGKEAAHEIPELPSWFDILNNLGITHIEGAHLQDAKFIAYSFIVMVFIIVWMALARKGMAIKPTSRLYIVTEMFMGGIRDFFGGVLGQKEIGRHIWLVGTLFIYILCMNLNGMVPGGFAPSASLGMNLAMAAVVFLYVQYTNFSRNGFGKWFHHMLGSPNDAIMWGLSPLFFVLHLLEEFIRPVSLSLRLFGNILGKDILLGVFIGLITIPVAGWFRVMIPLHWPFLFLALLLSVIQALIFSMLSAVYILLALPHGEEHH
jgi:F-type H+-transporting ATPase subunit a